MKTDHWDVVMLLLGSLVDDVKVVRRKVNEDFILFFFLQTYESLMKLDSAKKLIRA